MSLMKVVDLPKIFYKKVICRLIKVIFDIANPQNTAISLKQIHFIDKIKLILYPSPEFFTTGRRGGKYTSASVISEKRGT